MKFTSFTTVVLLLSLTANAAPSEKGRKAYIESKRAVDALAKGTQTCFTDGNINCREAPSLSAKIVTKTKAKRYKYSCYEDGDSYKGNETWDWNADLGCYVNGYYTDDYCSPSYLPTCYDI